MLTIYPILLVINKKYFKEKLKDLKMLYLFEKDFPIVNHVELLVQIVRIKKKLKEN